jgi:hypothetical protein
MLAKKSAISLMAAGADPAIARGAHLDTGAQGRRPAQRIR